MKRPESFLALKSSIILRSITCSFSSLFVFDELLFELLFVWRGEPGAMQAGAETRRSQ